MQIVFNPLSGLFDMVGNSTGSNSVQVDVNTNIIRELISIQNNAILSIASPAFVFVTDGNAGRVMTVTSNSQLNFT